MKLKISINKTDLDNELNIPLNFDSLCSICGSDILENDKYHILPCVHKFHYDCLLKFLKTDLSYPRCNKCPYCRQEFSYLPLLNDIKPIKFIHKEYYYEKEIIKCKGVYLSGQLKGLQCNNMININKNNDNDNDNELNNNNENQYCRYHKNQSIKT